jgi:sensor histidine kinase regulating citrate/malate metabolism
MVPRGFTGVAIGYAIASANWRIDPEASAVRRTWILGLLIGMRHCLIIARECVKNRHKFFRYLMILDGW